MTRDDGADGRSPVFKLGRDYSNAIFDAGTPAWSSREPTCRSTSARLIFATKAVAKYFERRPPGDVFYHNDPVTGGSHPPGHVHVQAGLRRR